jgi:hypothetical protein
MNGELGQDRLVDVTDRLARWVVREFPAGTAERVLHELRSLPSEVVGSQDVERVQAALVLRARGDWRRFLAMRDLAGHDWRDALVAADLADEDWQEHLAANLG